MPRRSNEPATPRVVWADQLVEYAQEMRTDAGRLRDLEPGSPRAEWLDRQADRLEERIQKAACEWVPTDAAALLLNAHPDTIRWRCRRWWAPAGQARKSGGLWEVHTSALAAA